MPVQLDDAGDEVCVAAVDVVVARVVVVDAVAAVVAAVVAIVVVVVVVGACVEEAVFQVIDILELSKKLHVPILLVHWTRMAGLNPLETVLQATASKHGDAPVQLWVENPF